MKFSIHFLMMVALGGLVACSSNPKPPVEATPASAAVVPVKKDSLATARERYSYALGMDMGHALKNVDADLDKDILLRSVRDQLEGNPSLMTDSQAEKALQELLVEIQARKDKKSADSAKKALDDQTAFLTKNKTAPGVITTASGLQYKIITPGTGASPKTTDKVSVHYVGSLLDGTEFDSSIKRGEPLEFPVDAVIQGWQELLCLMKEGMKVKAWIPSSLGYGAEGASPVIPPNSLLIFEVELLKVIPDPASVDTSAAKADTTKATTTKSTAKTAPAASKTAAPAKADTTKATATKSTAKTASAASKTAAPAKADTTKATATKSTAKTAPAASKTAAPAKADTAKAATKK